MLVMWSAYRLSVCQYFSYRDTIVQWNKPDSPPENTTFFDICHKKQYEMRRLITAANIPAG
jgi:hypothetical protein